MNAEKDYVIRHFDDNQDCEDFCNEMAATHRVVAFADTNSYCTVLLEKRAIGLLDPSLPALGTTR